MGGARENSGGGEKKEGRCGPNLTKKDHRE